MSEGQVRLIDLDEQLRPETVIVVEPMVQAYLQ